MVSFVNLSSIVTASKDQVSCDLSGEAAILELKAGIYYGLDEVGAKAWRMIQQPRVVSDIVSALKDQYVVEAERLRQDMIVLFQELADKGLVEVNNR